MLEVTEEVKVKLTIEQKELILNELNLKLWLIFIVQTLSLSLSVLKNNFDSF